MSCSRLELGCKDRKVTVNFNHDLKVIPRQKKVDSDVLKNINISSLLDLREELKPGLKRQKLKPKSSKTWQQMHKLR